MPTPAGVPVAITSPGYSVMPREMVSISVGMSKIRSVVRASWRSSPFAAAATDHHRQLGLVIDLGRDPGARQSDFVGGADHALRHLGEDDGPLVDALVGLEDRARQLLRVGAVVATHAPQAAPRSRQRRFELDRGKGQARSRWARHRTTRGQVFKQSEGTARADLLLASRQRKRRDFTRVRRNQPDVTASAPAVGGDAHPGCLHSPRLWLRGRACLLGSETTR